MFNLCETAIYKEGKIIFAKVDPKKNRKIILAAKLNT